MNLSPTESTSNSVCRPGAGVAQYPDIGVPAFMWRIPIMDSTNLLKLARLVMIANRVR